MDDKQDLINNKEIENKPLTKNDSSQLKIASDDSVYKKHIESIIASVKNDIRSYDSINNLKIKSTILSNFNDADYTDFIIYLHTRYSNSSNTLYGSYVRLAKEIANLIIRERSNKLNILQVAKDVLDADDADHDIINMVFDLMQRSYFDIALGVLLNKSSNEINLNRLIDVILQKKKGWLIRTEVEEFLVKLFPFGLDKHRLLEKLIQEHNKQGVDLPNYFIHQLIQSILREKDKENVERMLKNILEINEKSKVRSIFNRQIKKNNFVKKI